jgi:hypothetical protein
MRSAIHYQPIFIANLYRKVFLALTKPDKLNQSDKVLVLY